MPCLQTLKPLRSVILLLLATKEALHGVRHVHQPLTQPHYLACNQKADTSAKRQLFYSSGAHNKCTTGPSWSLRAGGVDGHHRSYASPQAALPIWTCIIQPQAFCHGFGSHLGMRPGSLAG